MSSLGDLHKNNFFGGHAVQKLEFWFLYCIAAEFGQMLKNYEGRLSKYNFAKKIILHKRVSNWDSTVVS
jgi:hypothetical protein